MRRNSLTGGYAPPNHPPTVYDLLPTDVTHESVAGTTRDKVNTMWKNHVRAGGGGGDGERWFEVHDLIAQEVRKEMIFSGESVLQVWQRQDAYDKAAAQTNMDVET